MPYLSFLSIYILDSTNMYLSLSVCLSVCLSLSIYERERERKRERREREVEKIYRYIEYCTLSSVCPSAICSNVMEMYGIYSMSMGKKSGPLPAGIRWIKHSVFWHPSWWFSCWQLLNFSVSSLSPAICFLPL